LIDRKACGGSEIGVFLSALTTYSLVRIRTCEVLACNSGSLEWRRRVKLSNATYSEHARNAIDHLACKCARQDARCSVRWSSDSLRRYITRTDIRASFVFPEDL